MSSDARYTPWLSGKYQVSPGLRPLGTDFGNGTADRQLFQGGDITRHLANKAAAVAEREDKYVLRDRLDHGLEEAVVRLIKDRPALGEEILFPIPPDGGQNELDLLVSQVGEDVAIAQLEADGTDRLVYLNVCAPSHWVPEEKIGRSFVAVHEPVPGFGKVSAAAPSLLAAATTRGPFVRFVWSLETDDRLNHHPVAPPGHDQAEWWGREFGRLPFVVRTERQCLWPLPAHRAYLFTIRVGFWYRDEVMANPNLLAPLEMAIRSMNAAERAYKGIDVGFQSLLAQLAPTASQ